MAKRKKSPQNTKKVKQNINTVQKRRNVAQNIRNAADVIGDARKNVKNKIKTHDKVHFSDLKQAKKKTFADWVALGGKTIRWDAESIEQGAKYAGVAILWLVEYLIRVLNALVIDNKIIRVVEDGVSGIKVDERKKDNKWQQFKKGVKNHPVLISYLVYYIALVLAVSGAAYKIFGDDTKETKKETVKKNTASKKDYNLDKLDKQKYEKELLMLDTYWEDLAKSLLFFETYRPNPKLQTSESRLTRGIGLTWDYSIDKNGRLVQTDKVTYSEDNYKDLNFNLWQSKLHLIFETFRKLKDVPGVEKFSRDEIIALVCVGYQRSGDMEVIAKRLLKEKTSQAYANDFKYYTGRSRWYTGTMKRRWWCAMIALGKISVDDISNLPRDSFSRINLNTVNNPKTGFYLKSSVINVAMQKAKGSKLLSAEEFLEENDVSLNGGWLSWTAALDGIKSGVGKVVDNVSGVVSGLINDVVISDEDNVKEESLEKVQEGLTEYSKCDYEEAIKLFQEAIVLDSLNMEAYSSLAIAYKKLGDKEKSIDYYEKSIDAVVKCNALMNDNKDLLLDREVKAATYYNAGLARQKMAELYEKQGNSKMAQFQYTKAKQNFTTALDNAEMENMDEKRQEIYKNAVESMKKAMEKYKTQSLLNGREKIQEQTKQRVLNNEILATKRGMFA